MGSLEATGIPTPDGERSPDASTPTRPGEPAGAGAHGAEPRIERLFEMTSDLLATISLDGRFTLLNSAWERLLGWKPDELIQRPIEELMHPADVERTRALLRGEGRGSGQLETFTSRCRHRDGSWRWLMWSARRENGTWYAAVRDVTDKMWLERQALHDPLTRLPNRLLLMDRASQALARLHRSEGVVAMLFIDLDRFKAVNDNLGHDAGDQLLVGISERLAELMRDSDTVARLGGDEFVVLAEDIDSEEEAISLAQRVLAALERPFAIGSTELAVLASVGVSVSRTPETDPEAMLREADLAMYRAKVSGGQRLELFGEVLREELSTHTRIEGRLRYAVPQRELSLAFQPIVPLAGGQAIGCEALVRWNPSGLETSVSAQMLPATFLPTVEGSELIVQIGTWVLHAALAQAERWRRIGIAVPVSVNVSARELTEHDLAERVRESLAYCRLPGGALWLEVSEEAVLRDPDRARSALKDVRRLGVRIALDQFGSGRFALGLPRDFPLDVLKLDRLLTGSFDHDKDRRAMFAATIALAREAGLTAIAMGIETNSQLALARELDCSVGQGFLLHEPSSAQELRLRDGAGAVTSPPWRPLVRLGGSNRRR